MTAPDIPLFVETHDFLLWLIQHTQRFPKNLRHSYMLKLETLALEFQEAILMANTVRGQQRSQWLSRAEAFAAQTRDAEVVVGAFRQVPREAVALDAQTVADRGDVREDFLVPARRK